ncbi:MAG: hypothetical protein Q8R76_05950 [Candidatus Omnitrophota bacterium]|nr:hypothetical protein [Candidatus Omnitrophota bacterium]
MKQGITLSVLFVFVITLITPPSVYADHSYQKADFSEIYTRVKDALVQSEEADTEQEQQVPQSTAQFNPLSPVDVEKDASEELTREEAKEIAGLFQELQSRVNETNSVSALSASVSSYDSVQKNVEAVLNVALALKGDFDNDGQVTARDEMMRREYDTWEINVSGDVNGDGVVDATDVYKLRERESSDGDSFIYQSFGNALEGRVANSYAASVSVQNDVALSPVSVENKKLEKWMRKAIDESLTWIELVYNKPKVNGGAGSEVTHAPNDITADEPAPSGREVIDFLRRLLHRVQQAADAARDGHFSDQVRDRAAPSGGDAADHDLTQVGLLPSQILAALTSGGEVDRFAVVPSPVTAKKTFDELNPLMKAMFASMSLHDNLAVERYVEANRQRVEALMAKVQDAQDKGRKVVFYKRERDGDYSIVSSVLHEVVLQAMSITGGDMYVAFLPAVKTSET